MDVCLSRIEPSDLAAAARRAACHLVKTRARHYARRPWSLDALHPSLSTAPPHRLVAIAAHLVERERRSPRRWFGFGGEVSLVNARAALLLGRALRRTQPASVRHDASNAGEERGKRPHLDA